MRKAYLADDDPFLLALNALIVEDHDYEVKTFKSGESLLSYLRGHPEADLVITDYEMPGKNGLEVLREIHDAPELKDLTVVVLTATAGLEAQVEAAGGRYAMKGTHNLIDILEKLE